MKVAAILILWISVFITGAFLRFEHLSKRPFHADEATGARITAKRLEEGGGQFNPKHYHGPLLADLAIPLCKLRGESRWQELTKATLRTLPAIAGTLLVLLPLLWRRRCGDVPMALAGALLATSPLLVYYSRMFIHEMLLVWFGMLALVALTSKPRWGLAGVFIGLMFATKESFAISMIAWAAAGLLVAWENRRTMDREWLVATWRQYRLAVGISLIAAAVTSMAVYTDGFRHWQGALDAFRTFFVYETVAGHDKPFGYYYQLLMLPKKSGGVWWFETPLVVLALLAYASTFRRGPDAVKGRALIRFISYAAAGHFLIYSLIAYKTPWLACLPWAHVCLLAGFAAAGIAGRTRPWQALSAVLAACALVTQFYQARRATGRYASDERNPYAYVPTRSGIEMMESFLCDLGKATPRGALEPVAVIGGEYWPLPWYLREFDQIGYWQSPPEGLAGMPLVFTLPDSTAAVMDLLKSTHQWQWHGLRDGVLVYMFVRNDISQRWLESDTR